MTDLALVNANVLTMDRDRPRATAVAVFPSALARAMILSSMSVKFWMWRTW